MKTDIEIKDDLYEYINHSVLSDNVTGTLSKQKRPFNSKREDIVISILANQNGQKQEAFVNVNIYVADKNRAGQYEEDSQRLRTLCHLSSMMFNSYHSEEYWITLDSQRVIEVEATHEHMINNKILYKTIND